MATTLSYGYIKPADGDRGSVWFPALAANTQQLNDHNHNGTNSALLTIQAITVTTQSISSASWSATSGGMYKQTVTLPGTLTFDAVSMEFRITSSKYLIYPTVEKVTSTTYDVYTNDNTIGMTAIYST